MIETYRSSLAIFFGNKQHEIDIQDIKRARYAEPYQYMFDAMSLQDFIVLKQEHTNKGLAVDYDTLISPCSLYEHVGDYLVTDRKNCGLIVLTADCLPIIFYDHVKKVTGIAHAGWRGSALGVAVQTVQSLQDNYGSSVSDIEIFYGANAQTCCYEVSPGFVEHFKSYNYAQKAFIKRDNALCFDNKLFITLQLQSIGIKIDNIYNKDLHCTICHQEYCSARREKQKAGRQMTVVALK